LPEDQIGGGVAAARSGRNGQGRVVFEHADVTRVGDVEVAAGIHRDAKWIAQTGRAHTPVAAAAGSETVVLPEDQVGRTADARKRFAAGEWGAVFEYATVVVVGDVEVAAGVHRNPVREAKVARAHRAIVVARAGNEVGLPDHQVGRAAANEGGHILVAQHAVVVGVRYIEPVRYRGRVDCNREGLVEAAGVDQILCTVGKVELPEHHIGGGTRDKRCVVFEHAAVAGVRDIDVARICRNPVGKAQIDGARRASVGVGIAGGGSEAAALPEHHVGGSIAATRSRGNGQRRVVFEHAAVVHVCDVEVVRSVQRNSKWAAEAVRAQPAIVPRSRAETAGLSENQVCLGIAASRNIGNGQRGVVFKCAVVGGIRDVNIADAVHRNPEGRVEAVRAYPAIIRGARAEAAALPEDQICGRVAAARSCRYGQRRVVFEHAAVIEVRDVDVARSVHRDSIGEAEAVRAYPAIIGGAGSKESALPEHCVGGAAHTREAAAGGERRVVFKHPVIAAVSHIEIPVGIYRNSWGLAQGARA
jgi:hypothetical protein